MKNTRKEYSAVMELCRNLFQKKGQDYGTAWRILRLTSLTDQIFIKANRLRSIQLSGVQKIEDPMEGEFIGIINYSIMALIQIEKGVVNEPDIDAEEALQFGLISKIVPVNSLEQETNNLAKSIASKSLPILILAKEAILRSFESTLSEGMVNERRLFHSTFELQDRKEGMLAFLEKRNPNFKNN